MRASLLWCLVFLISFSPALTSQTSRIDSFRKVLLITREDTSKCKILIRLAKEFQKESHDSDAFITLKEVLQLARRSNYPGAEADALAALGSYYFYAFDYDRAIDYYTQSMDIRKKTNNQSRVAQALFYIGTAYLRQSRYDKALNNYIASLNIYEKLDDNNSMYGLLNNIGGIYYNQNNYEKTLEYFLKALETIRKTGNRSEIASELNNIGQLYTMMDKNLLAMDYFQQALKENKQITDEFTYAQILGNIGSLYLKMGKYDKALEYLIQASERNRKMDNKIDLSNNFTNIAEAYDKMNVREKSLEYLNKALELERETQDKEQLKLTYKQLASLYQRGQKFQQAFQYQQLYSSLTDSLFSTESAKQIAEMETKYQTEKKEQDNRLLNKQLEIQQIQGRQQKMYLVVSIIILVLIGFLAAVLFRQNKQKQETNRQLSEKSKIIEEQHKDITDSIIYAQRIQQAILPPDKMWYELWPDSFVLYKPKDILSGDFYWIERKKGHVFVAAADCTGHGVPGALMSVVNTNLLNKAVLEQDLLAPNSILDAVNQWLTIALHQSFNESAVRDGMDIALCAIDVRSKRLQFAGAFNGAYIFKKDGTFMELNGDKMPVGAFIEDKMQMFSSSELAMEEGDRVFLFSDGYADQFGGPAGKKLKYKQLKTFIADSLSLSMSQQKEYLDKKFMEWKGDHEQVDDVLVVGIAF